MGTRSEQTPEYGAEQDPCGCRNLCHQAIFMNHATSAVTPPDPELVQAGDTVGQRAERCGLLQGSVRPVRVVEILVFPQHDHQVAPTRRPPTSADADRAAWHPARMTS